MKETRLFAWNSKNACARARKTHAGFSSVQLEETPSACRPASGVI